MLLRTIADNYGELLFSRQLPPSLRHLKIPDARYYGASGPFGDLLYQEIPGHRFSVWHRSFRLQRYATFTCIHAQPALKFLFQLNNSIQYNSAALGNMEYHERGYNLVYVPSVHNKLYFRKEGLYTILEVYCSEDQLQQLESFYPPLSGFLENTQQQQPDLLMRVNQVAHQNIIRIINELLFERPTDNLGELYLESKCLHLLMDCLDKITHAPRVKPIRIRTKEIDCLYTARDLLAKNLQAPFYLGDLAKQVQLSPYKLKACFQKMYNITPAEYLYHLRMERAKLLLNDNHLSIHEVAEHTGYSNINSFIAAYKRYYNISPLAYFKTAMSNRQ